MDFCVSEGNKEMDVGTITQLIDGGISNTTEEVSITVSSSLRLITELTKLPSGPLSAYGNIQVGEWGVFKDVYHPLKSLKIAFVIPSDLEKNNAKDSCLIFTVPSSFLPLSMRSSVCVPPIVNKTILHAATLSVIQPNNTDPICQNGAFVKMDFSKQSEKDFYLSKTEKWNIYMRLIHVSYFLFAIAVALICFSSLRTKTYSSVVTIDKMPLTL